MIKQKMKMKKKKKKKKRRKRKNLERENYQNDSMCRCFKQKIKKDRETTIKKKSLKKRTK